MTQKLEKSLTQDQIRDQFIFEMEKIMWMVRAGKGLPPEPKDAISNLINVKNQMERSRFPTYTILTQVVYLKLGYLLYGEEAKILNQWSEELCHALIAYKGQGRKEWVEAHRSTNVGEQTTFSFGSQTQPQQPKRRWYQRKSKEETEFKDK